eukprot:1001128-Prymnesium_polylepis.1
MARGSRSKSHTLHIWTIRTTRESRACRRAFNVNPRPRASAWEWPGAVSSLPGLRNQRDKERHHRRDDEERPAA